MSILSGVIRIRRFCAGGSGVGCLRLGPGIISSFTSPFEFVLPTRFIIIFIIFVIAIGSREIYTDLLAISYRLVLS